MHSCYYNIVDFIHLMNNISGLAWRDLLIHLMLQRMTPLALKLQHLNKPNSHSYYTFQLFFSPHDIFHHHIIDSYFDSVVIINHASKIKNGKYKDELNEIAYRNVSCHLPPKKYFNKQQTFSVPSVLQHPYNY